jgi:hypothetical protein
MHCVDLDYLFFVCERMKKLPLNKDAFAYWGQNAKALLL